MFIDQSSPARLTLLVLLAVALAVAGGGQTSQAATDASAPGNSVGLTIATANLEQEVLVAWAAGRFADAGLELPPVIVSFHESRVGCAGAAGLFFWGPPARVELCVLGDPGSTGARIVALHELGHAWVELTANRDTRDRFLAIRGLDSWRDDSLPVWRWGQEQAAAVLAWGLLDQPVPVATIYDADDEDLIQAYESLVGGPPLHSQHPMAANEGRPAP